MRVGNIVSMVWCEGVPQESIDSSFRSAALYVNDLPQAVKRYRQEAVC